MQERPELPEYEVNDRPQMLADREILRGSCGCVLFGNGIGKTNTIN